MKIICCLACVFLLSSCVYYGAEYEFEGGSNNTKSTCDAGTKKETEKCRADIRKINEAIQTQKNKQTL